MTLQNSNEEFEHLSSDNSNSLRVDTSFTKQEVQELLKMIERDEQKFTTEDLKTNFNTSAKINRVVHSLKRYVLANNIYNSCKKKNKDELLRQNSNYTEDDFFDKKITLHAQQKTDKLTDETLMLVKESDTFDYTIESDKDFEKSVVSLFCEKEEQEEMNS